MPQARRTRPRGRSGHDRGAAHGFGMLLVGIIVGAIGSALFFGMRGESPAVGSGLKRILEASRQADQAAPAQAVDQEQPPPRTRFDFYTVLPEIERVIPSATEPEPPPAAAGGATASAASPPPQASAAAPASSGYYMLQAASFRREPEADRLKARLALSGLEAQIQQVTIQGQGEFYRVRLGPYADMAALEQAHRQLAQLGIEALRLKVSSP